MKELIMKTFLKKSWGETLQDLESINQQKLIKYLSPLDKLMKNS